MTAKQINSREIAKLKHAPEAFIRSSRKVSFHFIPRQTRPVIPSTANRHTKVFFDLLVFAYRGCRRRSRRRCRSPEHAAAPERARGAESGPAAAERRARRGRRPRSERVGGSGGAYTGEEKRSSRAGVVVSGGGRAGRRVTRFAKTNQRGVTATNRNVRQLCSAVHTNRSRRQKKTRHLLLSAILVRYLRLTLSLVNPFARSVPTKKTHERPAL